MDDDDFFSAFEELQESTAKAEAIHKALGSDSDGGGDNGTTGPLASASATSTHSTDSAGSLAGGESDVEIIERPSSTASSSAAFPTLNMVTNPDGTKTITFPPGTDPKRLLAGLQPTNSAAGLASTLNPKISVIPDSARLANAHAAMRGGKQVVSLSASGVATHSFVGGMGNSAAALSNGAVMHNQMLRHPAQQMNRPIGNARSGSPITVMTPRGPMPANVQSGSYGKIFGKSG